jgi:hypothetical protein
MADIPELPDGWKIFHASFIDDGQDRGWSMTILNKKRTVAPRLTNIEIRGAASCAEGIQKANAAIRKAV